MGLLDFNKPVIPISGVADLLNAKARTIRMYHDKGLLPKHEGVEKGVYSLHDVKQIALVHYLASVKKVNANGIKYILELLDNYMDETTKENLLKDMEQKLENTPSKEIEEMESL